MGYANSPSGIFVPGRLVSQILDAPRYLRHGQIPINAARVRLAALLEDTVL